MKVSPLGKSTVTAVTNTNASADARARAIAKLTQPAAPPPQAPQPQHTPPVDANNVSAEEVAAVQPPTAEPQTEQSHMVEESSAEAPVETAPPAPPKNDPMQVLARREKALRAKALQQEQAFKAREAKLAEREAALAAKDGEYQSNYVSKQRLKEQTLQALADAGVTYDEVTQQMIDAGSVSPAITAHINRLEARLAKQEAELEKTRQGTTEQQQQAYNAAIKQINRDATALVKADASFELIRNTNSVKEVVDLIKAHHAETGEVMDIEDAAARVEAELEERMNKIIDRTEKIKKRMQAKPAASQAPQTQQPNSTKQQQPMKTLTNAASSTRQLSAKERAILAFKGELKS